MKSKIQISNFEFEGICIHIFFENSCIQNWDGRAETSLTFWFLQALTSRAEHDRTNFGTEPTDLTNEKIENSKKNIFEVISFTLFDIKT